MNMFPDDADLYHTGIVVHDLERAKAEMSEQLGVTWGVQGESEQPVVLESGPASLTFGFAYSARGPHRIELVQAIPGTLWEVPRPGRARLGYWSEQRHGHVRGAGRAGPAACRPGRNRPVGRAGADRDAPGAVRVLRQLVDRSLREVLFVGCSRY